MLTTVDLSQEPKYKKFQLASIVGYKVMEYNSNGRCYIIGADNFIDNDFRCIDDVLLLINNELTTKGFRVVR